MLRLQAVTEGNGRPKGDTEAAQGSRTRSIRCMWGESCEAATTRACCRRLKNTGNIGRIRRARSTAEYRGVRGVRGVRKKGGKDIEDGEDMRGDEKMWKSTKL